MKATTKTAERLAVVRTMAAEGASDRQIAETVGMTTTAVCAMRRRHGIESGYTASGPTHGLASTYSAYGCRCDPCRAANAERHRNARRKRQERLNEVEISHGVSGYRNWGCRCGVCTAANTEATAPAVRSYRRRNPDRFKSQCLNRYSKNQAETLERASRRGQEWTGPELEIVARDDLTAKQAALMLGRTYAAVLKMRRNLQEDPKTISLAGIARSSREAA